MVTKVSDSSTNTTVLEWTHAEVQAILKADAEAAGHVWPDFGVDEADQVICKFRDGLGNEVQLDAARDATHQVVLTDAE